MATVKVLIILICLGSITPTLAQDQFVSIPMHLKSAKTFYVTGRAEGSQSGEYMVDTGSSYTTINQSTLGELRKMGGSRYLRDLVAVMANGDELTVPVYRVARFEVGGICVLGDIEVAVFPRQTRQILGLSALRKASPFLFSVDPPELKLSNCRTTLPEQSVGAADHST
jgi:predicted aspartyl protease